jgi:hypothetical protein
MADYVINNDYFLIWNDDLEIEFVDFSETGSLSTKKNIFIDSSITTINNKITELNLITTENSMIFYS